jgi:DNA-binding transcriptional MerR regulator
MRMAELSSRTGVPIPTIKFYLREGLLSAGERTSPNQAQYGEQHVRRLKLIRALIDVGGLPVAVARTVLDRLDNTGSSTFETLGKVQYSLMQRKAPPDDEGWRAAQERVRALLDRHGWRVGAANPAHAALVDVVAALDRLGQQDVLGILDEYVNTARGLAAAEVDLVRARESLEARAEGVVIVSVLGDALLAALRRLAHEDLVAGWLGPTELPSAR